MTRDRLFLSTSVQAVTVVVPSSCVRSLPSSTTNGAREGSRYIGA